jgi:hypothetical protein
MKKSQLIKLLAPYDNDTEFVVVVGVSKLVKDEYSQETFRQGSITERFILEPIKHAAGMENSRHIAFLPLEGDWVKEKSLHFAPKKVGEK